MMKYAAIRTASTPIEVAYNLGRFFDHVGMHSRSVFYYEKALNLAPICSDNHITLFYARQNLSLAYLRSGNIKLASNCIKQNIF